MMAKTNDCDNGSKYAECRCESEMRVRLQGSIAVSSLHPLRVS
jgi:hypothetical protein